jgi:Flp pilus assembly pilin Flp
MPAHPAVGEPHLALPLELPERGAGGPCARPGPDDGPAPPADAGSAAVEYGLVAAMTATLLLGALSPLGGRVVGVLADVVREVSAAR